MLALALDPEPPYPGDMAKAQRVFPEENRANVQVKLRLPPDVKALLQALAEEADMTDSDYVASLVIRAGKKP